MANKSVCSMQKKKESLAKKSEATYNPDKVKSDEMRLDAMSGVDDFYDGVKKYGFDLKDRGYWGSGKDGVYYRTIWLTNGKRKSGPNTNHTIKIGYDTNENTPFVAIDQYVLGSVKDLLTVIEDNFAPKTMEALAKKSESKKSEGVTASSLFAIDSQTGHSKIYDELCDIVDRVSYSGVLNTEDATDEYPDAVDVEFEVTSEDSAPCSVMVYIYGKEENDEESQLSYSIYDEYNNNLKGYIPAAQGAPLGSQKGYKISELSQMWDDIEKDIQTLVSNADTDESKKKESKKNEGVYGTIRVDSEDIAIKVQESHEYPSASGRSLTVEIPKVEAWFSSLSEFSDCIDGLAENCNGYPDISRDGSDILVQINAPKEDESDDYEVIVELRCSTEITSTSLEGVVDLLNHD